LSENFFAFASRRFDPALKMALGMETPDTLGIIAGSGVYPLLLADAARVAGVKKIIVAAGLYGRDIARHHESRRQDRMAACRTARETPQLLP
jgi:hypothetical protein